MILGLIYAILWPPNSYILLSIFCLISCPARIQDWLFPPTLTQCLGCCTLGYLISMFHFMLHKEWSVLKKGIFTCTSFWSTSYTLAASNSKSVSVCKICMFWAMICIRSAIELHCIIMFSALYHHTTALSFILYYRSRFDSETDLIQTGLGSGYNCHRRPQNITHVFKGPPLWYNHKRCYHFTLYIFKTRIAHDVCSFMHICNNGKCWSLTSLFKCPSTGSTELCRLHTSSESNILQ